MTTKKRVWAHVCVCSADLVLVVNFLWINVHRSHKYTELQDKTVYLAGFLPQGTTSKRFEKDFNISHSEEPASW